MAKIVFKKTTMVFTAAILVLMGACIGLLVALLKSQQQSGDPNSDSGSISSLPDQTTTVATPPSWSTEFRLTKQVEPLHYDLHLKPDLDPQSMTFSGEVTIKVTAKEATKYFVVHKSKLDIEVAEVRTAVNGTELEVAEKNFYERTELYVMELKEEVPIGEYELYFRFRGSLNGGNIVGFYSSSYTDPQGGKKYLATSKFQPTYARRAFPCFDEPSFKSNFTVTLDHPPEYETILSNMPLQESKPTEEGRVITKFKESVPMVTYLVCFIVCDFKYKEQEFVSEGETKKFRVFASPHQVEKTKFALDVGVDVIKYYEKYFEIDYPLPKQDMIAIPDFSSGAMEHWGLITYRETNLLYDKKMSSNENKQRVAVVIAHELAHMWFGNLVTMEWWDNLWLNEGFASYMEYKAVHNRFPEWHMLDQFLTADLQPVMLLDATNTSHPIIQTVTSNDEITEIFDTISYNKGAAVLRMLEFFVGEKEFSKGISNYLKKYKYKTARTNQLWEEMTTMTGQKYNISEIMDTWTKQMGFPYINVTRDSLKTFTASQKRFLINPEMEVDYNSSPYKYVWKIPLSYVTCTGDFGIVWLNINEIFNFDISNVQADCWVKFNRNQTGYYLINYQKEEWKRISDILRKNHTAFTPSDRANFLFDAFQLAENGLLEYDIPLEMTNYLVKEKDLTPWETAYNGFVRLGHILENTAEGYALKDHVKNLSTALYEELGWNSTVDNLSADLYEELGLNKTTNNHINSLLQSTIVGLACYSGNEHCIQEAVKKLDEWATKRTTDVPLNLKRVVLHYGMSNSGSEETWETFWSMYMDEKSAQERVTLLYGLAHTDQVNMIDRLLLYASDTISYKIKSQDFFTVLTYIAGNPVGRPIVWDYVRKNWAQLVKRFSLNDRYLGRAVKSICDYFTTEKELETMKEFFESTDSGAGEMARNQALQNVRNNIRWLKMNKDSVGKFFKMPWNSYRLSESVIPIHYDLLLHPNLMTDQFTGHVTILVNVTEEMNYLVLHSKNLDITKTEVRNKLTNKVVLSHKSVLYEVNEFLVTPLKATTEVDQQYELYYEFKGMLNGSLVGFYKSSYVFRYENGTEEIRHLATSQFQSTYARQAFPCFDEPNFKSTFTVTLVHPEELIAISNMPAVEEIKDIGRVDKLRETRFEKSVKMVTYLVAVIVCDFEYQEGSAGNTTVRVYAAPHQVDQAKYALDVAIKTLQYFEGYFNIPYPLPKLDMIAIPDFRAGAMENWGLVTYRETNLLYKEGTTPTYNQLRIGAVIGHELAHMWFGNLVTMKWWSDLWLNEGFASYIEYKSMEHVDPSWQSDSQFFLEDMQRVLVRDATHESHPIVQEVGHPDQISELFDAISYSKGASVLRMLEFFMGNSFQKGVSKYLETYSYQNTETADLWKILQDSYTDVEKTDSSNITDIMDRWTLQMGYPCISIQRSENGMFNVSQNRFLLDSQPNLKDVSPFNYVWKIPLSFITANNSVPSIVWLNGDSKEILIDVGNESTWVKFNADHKGYYIVDYKEEWDKLIAILNKDHKQLKPSDRSNLISDAFLLARAGLMKYSKALDLSTYLTKEPDFVPWATASSSLSYIADLLEEPSEKNNEIKNYLDNLSVGQVKVLQWEDLGSHLTKRLRATVISVSCKSGNVNCLNSAERELTYWLEKKPISPNLKNVIFCYGMKQIGNESVWDEMWKRYLAESSSQERVMLLNGLSCTNNKDLLKKYIDLAWNESYVRSQDYFNVLSNIASNPEGLQMVWDFFRDNWTKLVQRFTINNSYLGGAIKNICRHFKTEARLKEMEMFFNENKEAGAGENARKESLETVQGNIRWIKTHKSEVSAWLKEQNKPFRNVRLPRYIVPKEYDVRLQPDLERGVFNGTVTITVQLKKPSKFFVVHAASLNMTDITRVTRGINTEIKIKEEFPFPENEYWVLEMEHEVEEGYYQLKFCFVGTMTGLKGFYRSTYRNSKNETRNIATSQFQSTDARRAFPCFDEPSFKSHFTITLVHPEGYIALSNMPPRIDHENKPIGNGLLETKFMKTTKPMVTYLVCVIVCDFTERSIIGGNKNIPIRVYAAPDSYNLTEYALDAGKAVLETLEEYFKIDYPLPKLDMIAIPDFRAGAMENWGLITYREIYMLFDKDKTPPSTQFSIYMIIAHEIAHMWFGNLVTMEWWDDLWLNEGFATYMAYKVTTMNNKGWNGVGHFMLKEMNRALRVDGTKQSNPIVRIVNFPHEISAIFDSVTYGKGGSILRMIETFVEESNFQAGLQKYLNKYADKNAVTDDLWAELKDVSNELDVKGIMNTWTRQMGYPMICVTHNKNKTATVEQKRFLLNAESKMEESHVSPYWYIWKVPLEYTCIKDNKSEKLLMTAVREEINLSNCSDTSQIKWNSNQKGYYLINYDKESWEKWATDLSSDYKTLSSPLDRSNILNDAFLLAHSGNLTYDLLLDLTKYLKEEVDYIPWSTASGGLLEILRFLENNDEASTKMKSYIRELSNKQMTALGWNDTPDEQLNKRLLRSTIINLACAAKDSVCLGEASKLLKEFLDNEKTLPSALKSQVYRFGLSSSSSDDGMWDKLWIRYKDETSAQEQRDLLYGLAFTNSPEKLEEYIEKAEKEVRQQDFFTVINYISSNPKGLSIAWEYVKKKWPELVDRFSLQDSGLGGMVKTVTSKFTTEEKLNEVKAFFAEYPDAGAGASARKAALEIIDGNIRWKDNYEKTVADWLNTNVSP